MRERRVLRAFAIDYDIAFRGGFRVISVLSDRASVQATRAANEEPSMKRIQSIAAIALFAAAAAHAQTTYEPAVPRGLSDSAGPQSRELAQPAAAPGAPLGQTVEPVVPQLVMDTRRGRSDADARNCLQLASNRQIHRCAERYRPNAARARVTRTKAAKPAETKAASVKPADVAKPDLSKAAAPAKPVETAKVVPPVAPPPVIEKPGATAKAAPPEKSGEKSGEKGKWTDGAKALLHKQGDRLPQ